MDSIGGGTSPTVEYCEPKDEKKRVGAITYNSVYYDDRRAFCRSHYDG